MFTVGVGSLDGAKNRGSSRGHAKVPSILEGCSRRSINHDLAQLEKLAEIDNVRLTER